METVIMETVIGYARSASTGTSLSQQKTALLQADCESVFEETCSGMLPLADRTGLVEVLVSLQPSDTLVVCDVARLSRSFLCLAMVLSDLQKRDVKLRVLNQPREFTSLDQMLDQASHDLDALKRLDHSRHIKRGSAHAKETREQAT
ncbi:recombinase family protein [Armatimonas sp.]|uniref:recombinase family protein n=1 Tax=Armatimonas sp. TaxID=1872638 RepID=UPI00374CBE1A